MSESATSRGARSRSRSDRPRGARVGYHGVMFAVLVAAWVMVAQAPTLTQAQAEGPATAFVRARHEDVMRIIGRPAPTEMQRLARSREVWRALGELVDYEELARRALGSGWESLTAPQRAQFVALYRQLVEREYESSLATLLDFEISYTAETETREGVVVATTARSRVERRRPPIEITYTLIPAGGAWRVCDLRADGASTAETHRRSFARHLHAGGFEALLAHIRAQLARRR